MKKLALALALLVSGTLGSCIIVARTHCGGCESPCIGACEMQCDDRNCTMEKPCADCAAKMK